MIGLIIMEQAMRNERCGCCRFCIIGDCDFLQRRLWTIVWLFRSICNCFGSYGLCQTDWGMRIPTCSALLWIIFQVYLQHTPRSDDVDDDAVQRTINSELEKLLSLTERYSTSARDFPRLSEGHFRPGKMRLFSLQSSSTTGLRRRRFWKA